MVRTNNSDSNLREEILTNELGNRMLDMVSNIYDNSKVALNIYQAYGVVLSKQHDFILKDFIAQMFPQTATWGLRYWEEEFGIITDASKTIEERRRYLMSVMFKKIPMTPYRIKQIVTGITNIPCEVIENVAPNTMEIILRGYYQLSSVVKAELDKKLPAHLNYIFKMAELTGIEVATASAFTVTEFERYEVEVLN